MAGERFNVVSAGIEPSKVNPRAIQVMQEDGIDISHHTSDDVQKYVGDAFDYIITVCDNAKERCPVFPGSGERIHWSFPDPADATGTDEQILNVFRAIRDQIKSTLENFVITY